MRVLLSKQKLQSLQPKSKPYDVRCSKHGGLMVRVYPTGKVAYYCEWGRGKRKKLGEVGGITLDQARNVCQSVLGSVADAVKAGKKPDIETRPSQLLTLGEFMKLRYVPWVLENRTTGDQTAERIKACFESFYPKKLSDISPWVFEKWRTLRLKDGISKATVNRDLVSLKAALSKAVGWSLIESNPLASVKPMRVDKVGRLRFLDLEEIGRLKTALDARDFKQRSERASANEWRESRGYELLAPFPEDGFSDYLNPLIITALNTGMRRGELLALTWQKLNFAIRQIEVAGSAAKSQQTRHLPMNDSCFEALERWERQKPSELFVFAGNRGDRLKRVDRSLSGVLKQAKIADCTLHTLRHTFASQLAMAGVSLAVIRELLGHASLEMTLKYSHLAPDVKTEAVAKLVIQ